MIMDPLLHQQQEMSNTLENMLGCSKETKKAKAQPEHALKCPRCESTNTKFCYYNNYSLSQPRYFCKSCRRYWTKGGTLRNVPVGGGCRKNNKRPSSSLSKRPQSQDHQQPLNLITANQNSSYDSNDLTLAFARLQKQHMGFDHNTLASPPDQTNQGGSFFDALRFGYLEAQNQNQNQNPTNFKNFCYGYARNGDVENGSGSYHGDGDGEVVVTSMKQEMCRDQGYEQSRSLLGLPWQINESIDFNNMNHHSDVDPARESWNGFAPSWHGLLNSPLM